MTWIICVLAGLGSDGDSQVSAAVNPFTNRGDLMAQAPRNDLEPVPLGQRLLDRPLLLLLAGLIVMFGFYTLWGLYEILSLPKATLP
jgi:hypothetical protein